MKGGSAVLVVIVGLLILWLGVTGKFDCFSGVLACMLQKGGGPAQVTDAPAPAPSDSGAGSSDTQARAPGILDRITGRIGRGGYPSFAELLEG